MENNKNKGRKALATGQLFEALVDDKLQSPGGPALQTEEVRRLAHELSVHHVELEVQNEELLTAQQDIEEARRKYADLFDFAPSGYFVLDKDGAILDVNITGSTLLGARKDMLLGKSFSKFVHPDDQDLYYRFRRKMPGAGVSNKAELRLVNSDTGAPPLNASLEGLAVAEKGTGADQWRIAVTDVTERTSAGERAKFQASLLANISDAVYSVDLQMRLTSWNRAAERLYGWKEEEVLGKPVFEATGSIFDPDKRAALTRELLEKGTVSAQVGHTTRSGTPLVIESTTMVLRNMAGNPVGFVGVNHDITERVKADEALRQSEERFRAIAEAAPVGVGVISVPDAKFLYVNMSYIKSFGYTEADLIGQGTPQIYWNLDDREKLLGLLRKNGSVTDYEVRLKRKDGTPFWALSSLRPITFDGKPALLGTFVDISGRKQIEEKIGKLNRTLVALGKSSRAMARAEGEADYLKEVCRIIIEECDYKMTWIGFAKDDGEKSVVPVACAGFEEGYLENIRITWADTERGRGPTGTAIRTGRPCICRNMLTDPAFLPWRTEALQRGYASSIVLPLLDGPKAFGALTIYSREPDPFSREEEDLLMDLARDLAHGTTAIRIREARAKAEEKALLQTEELRRNFNELERFNRAMVDRELQMIKLKKQVNELHARLGEQPFFPLAYEDDEDTKRI